MICVLFVGTRITQIRYYLCKKWRVGYVNSAQGIAVESPQPRRKEGRGLGTLRQAQDKLQPGASLYLRGRHVSKKITIKLTPTFFNNIIIYDDDR